MRACPHCGKSNPDHSVACMACGRAMFAECTAVRAEGDVTGGIIPYKNPKALIAYYLGIASGLPLIGLPFGIAAFVLGIMGMQARKQNPAIKGSIHAGIGIGCGCLFSLLWTAVLVMIVIGLATKS